MSDMAQSETIELKPGGPDDPDGRRTASALAASVHAEQLSVFCRLLWRRLLIFALVWGLLGWVKVVPVMGVIIGLALFVALATAAGIADWRARKMLAQFVRPRR